MKARYILLIVIFLVVVVYLWSEQKETLESLDITYQKQLSKDIEFITIFMKNSIPDTLDLYNNNLTEKELSLFKNSLGNITLALDFKRVELEEIESFYDKNHNLSDSVENFYSLMFEIKENSGEIDEDVLYQMSDIIYEYSNKLSEINYRSTSLQNFFEQSPKLFNEMNQEIQDLVKLAY